MKRLARKSFRILKAIREDYNNRMLFTILHTFACKLAGLLFKKPNASFICIFKIFDCVPLVGEPQKKLSKAIARELLETEENYLNLLRFTVKDLKECLIDDTQSEYFGISYASRFILGNGQIINPTVAGVIFGNLPDILQLHEAIFKDLQKTVNEIALGKQVDFRLISFLINNSGAHWTMFRKSQQKHAKRISLIRRLHGCFEARAHLSARRK